MKSKFLLFFLILWLVSCKQAEPTPTYIYESNPHYSWGFAEFYGNYYNKYSNDNNVLSMTLFSDSLTVNEDGSLGGFGQTLYLEDIFLPAKDTFLVEQIYYIRYSTEPFSILPGRLDTIGDEVFPVGPSISYFEKDPTKSVGKLIKGGFITVSKSPDGRYSILCNLTTSDNLPLKGSFTSVLVHFDRSVALKARQNANVLPVETFY